MYSSNCSRAKLGPAAREPLHRHKGKSCGYYLKIVFFFSSLIQTLIIISLVLFVKYGQPEKSAVEKRVKELEQGFNRLSENNIQLRNEKANLEKLLKAGTDEKAALEKEMAKLKTDANKTEHDLRTKLNTCTLMARRVTTPVQPSAFFPRASSHNELETLRARNDQQKAKIVLIESNFTQMVQQLSLERDNALKDKAQLSDEAISLRSDNTLLKEQLLTYTRKCKEDFVKSLDGITTVTREFLERVNNLFPHQLTFHLTCSSQQEQMEKIKNSCTNLSKDVENKFQVYLNNVGDMVANIQSKSSRLEVENRHLTSSFQECERNRAEFVVNTKKQLELKQKIHDNKVESLLTEMNRLRSQMSSTKVN